MVIKNRKRDIIIVIAMVLLGWLIYSPMCTNYFTNGDGVSLGLVYRWSSDGVLLGRTGIGIIIRLFGHIVSPSLSLISCLFLYAFSSVLVIYIFNIRSYFEIDKAKQKKLEKIKRRGILLTSIFVWRR